MAPFFTAEQVALLAAGTVRWAWLAEAEFKSETVWLWAGDRILDFGGKEWRPTYGSVQVAGLGFSGEALSRQVTFSLPGTDATLLPLALAETEEADQQPLRLSLLFFGEDWQPIGGLIPIMPFGVMQPPRIDRSEVIGAEGPTQTITLPVENLFYNRARPPNGRYTDTDQKRRHPGDRICEFTPSLTFKSIAWPKF